VFPRKTRKFTLKGSENDISDSNNTSKKDRFLLKSTRKSRGFSLTWLLIALVFLLMGVYILDAL